MNNTSGFDMIEIVLKKDLKIPLDDLEEKWLSHIDEQIKNELFDLVNNSVFLDEIKEVIEHIVRKSVTLPKEQQDYIKAKCQERIQKLEFPSLSSKNYSFTNK